MDTHTECLLLLITGEGRKMNITDKKKNYDMVIQMLYTIINTKNSNKSRKLSVNGHDGNNIDMKY